MKDNDYVLLSSLCLDRKQEYEDLYNSRINSDECVHLDFKIGDYPAFYMETAELVKKVVEITRLDKEIAKLTELVPDVALQQLINKCRIDEIVITNNIEGVYSTRREISELLDDPEGKSNARFSGLVKKYTAILNGTDLSINDSHDVRSLYYEMFLKELAEEYPGERTLESTNKEHHTEAEISEQCSDDSGSYPKSEMFSGMDKAVAILNDSEIEPLFRIAIFHYLFGYIHLFQKGNGRLNRFISDYYLANTLESIMGYRLSNTIKDNLSKYYMSFDITNDKNNRGDITPFIITYVDFIRESAESFRDLLKEKVEDLNRFSKCLSKLPCGNEEKFKNLYYLLLQASLFSEIGISIGDLLKNLSLSRPTLQKRLKEIESYNLLITTKRYNNKFYRLDLEELDCE